MPKYPTDHAGLEILPFDRCLQLLATVPLGRVSFFADGEIVVLPVNHVMDGPNPVFRTARGSKLSAAEDQNLVAFEADDYDERTRFWMERPGQWPRGGHLRRPGDPALDPAWPAPVGYRRGPAVLDPDTTQCGKRAANARAQLCVLTQYKSHSLNRRNKTDRPVDLGPGSAGPTSLATRGSGRLRWKR